jgi:pyroglutamyl-peptidase
MRSAGSIAAVSKMASAKRILFSGFEAFGEATTNPTEALMRNLPPLTENGFRKPPGVEVRGIILPVTFAEAFGVLRQEIRDYRPHAVISFGLAMGRTRLEFERVAINCIDAEIADNSGLQPRNQPIEKDGESAYFSTLPIEACVSLLTKNGIPSGISNSAGTYVCNYLFYRLQQHSVRTLMRTGFVHVPSEAGMRAEALVRAAELIAESVF